MKLKGVYKQIRDLVNDPSGSFTHVHLEEFDDKGKGELLLIF